MSSTPFIGLIVTGPQALVDFKIFVGSLEVWHPNAKLYIYTDSDTAIQTIKTKCTIVFKKALDAYKGKRRQEMETTKGIVYDSMFKDYTYEKANVLKWIFDSEPNAISQGVWFMDADITHLAPLPIIPSDTTLALSPHYIQPSDEARFGKYNAGYIWFKNSNILDSWRTAGFTSHFFEQAALEQLVPLNIVYEFPIQVNYGWWRMFQSQLPPQDHAQKFKLFRPDKSIGIRYDNMPLQSIHTHWHELDNSVTGMFNRWFLQFLSNYRIHKPITNFMALIKKAKI